MPGRKNSDEEKKNAIVNFNLLIPVGFPVSMTPSELRELDDYVEQLRKKGKIKTRSEILRKILLKKIKCENESRILVNYPDVREKIGEARQQLIKVGMTIYPSQFSKTILIGLKEEIQKENDKKKT